MKESYVGFAIMTLGVISIFFIYFFQNVTNTDQHNYNLLKEVTKSAMYDSIDVPYYRQTGEIKISREKFVENFVRRFAESASIAHAYKIDFYDINEKPPKVSIRVSTSDNTTRLSLAGGQYSFDIVNDIDAILETKY